MSRPAAEDPVTRPRASAGRLVLRARGPFDFAATARSHGWVVLAPNRWDAEREVMGRVHRLASGRVVDLRLSAAGARGGDPGVAVEVRGAETLTAGERRALEADVAHMLRLDEDLSGFHALCAERGGRWARATEGLGRLLRSPTAFEDVVKTILTTNVQWGGTRRMARELVEAYGDPLPGPADEGARSFPTPEAIAGVPVEAFAGAVGLGYRAPYVHELATRVAGGDLDLEGLWRTGLPTAELERELRGIRGVGPYAAATLLMLAGHYDRLAVDSVFRDFVARRHFGGRRPTDAEARAVYEDWGKWRFLAYWLELTEDPEGEGPEEGE